MKSNIKYGVILPIALSILLLSYFVLNNSLHDDIKRASNSLQNNIKSSDNLTQDNTKPANNDKFLNETIHLSISSMLVQVTHEDLSNLSDTIVIGTVKEILPSKWNTIDGKQPNKPVDEISAPQDVIYTDVIIKVDKYLKNPLSPNEVTVRVVGGTIGNISMTVEDEPSFEPGENVLLYLYRDNDPNLKNIGPEHLRVTGFSQGKFILTDDGKALRQDENTTLDELLSTIK